MWTRKELKQNAKKRFTANYWKSVLAALILVIVLGGLGSGTGYKSNYNNLKKTVTGGVTGSVTTDSEKYIEKHDYFDEDGDMDIDFDSPEEMFEAFSDYLESEQNISKDDARTEMIAMVVGIISAVIVLGLIVTAISTVLNVFVLNPLEVGGRKFFTDNHFEDATVKAFGIGFSGNYLNVVKTMFLKGLFEFLWGLLLIVPGVIKAYEYRMIPYLLAENPDMSSDEAFEMSKQLMTGNKWRAFVLDLSFIGWAILSALTFGILGIFYVNPYIYQTEAELYLKLKELKGEKSDSATFEGSANYIEVE